MSRLRVSILGSVRVGVDGEEPVQLSGAPAALLGYLAVGATGGRRASRGEVAVGLWPDRDDEGARRALADAIYRLRQALPPGQWLRSSDNWLALVDVTTDVDELRRCAASADAADRTAALPLYEGDLLVDVDADWVTLPRLAAREAYLATLAAAWQDRDRAGDWSGALAVAERWVTHDPYADAAHLAVMRAHARNGNLHAALRHYDHVEDLLRQELDVEPGPDVQALAAQLRHEAELARRAGAATPSEAPFVGRLAERRLLVHHLDRAGAGEGGLAVVLGEAGIGKTRLLEELAGAAGWRGWQVSWGRGEAYRPPAPYAPFAEALEHALAGPRAVQVGELVGPGWADRLGTVLAGEPTPAWRALDHADLVAALRRVVDGLQAIMPQLLLVDDVQWADDGLWPLLADLAAHLRGRRVLIVLAGRIDELREQPGAWDRLRSWERDGAAIVRLGGLAGDALGELSLAIGAGALSVEQRSVLSLRSGGNPLLAMALLDHDGGADQGRASIETLVDRRLGSLPGRARGAIEAAAVLGHRVPFPIWRDVAGDPDLAVDAGALEEAGFLVLGPDGHVFAHDTLRSQVLAQLEPARRRLLHGRALDAVAARSPADVYALLGHAEHAGDRAAIARYATLAGGRAHDSASYRAATQHFTRALDAIEPDDLLGRFHALCGRARAHDVLAARESQRADVDEVQVVADRLADPVLIAGARALLAAYRSTVGDLAGAERSAREGLATIAPGTAPAQEAALLRTLSSVLRELGRHDESLDASMRAQAGYRQVGDRLGEATMTDLVGGIAWRRGELADAARHHREAADLFAELGHLLGEARALNNLGSTQWAMGAYHDARNTHERALAVCRELEDRQGEGDNLDNLGGVAWALGDDVAAIGLYEQALALRRHADDSWGQAISLINLGDAHRAMGAIDDALRCFAEALEISRRDGVARNVATALQGRGLALLDAGRVDDAVADLGAAEAAHVDLGDHDNLLQTRSGLARALLQHGDSARAQDLVAEVLAAMRPTDRADIREDAHLAAYDVLQAAGLADRAAAQLAAADAAMHEATDHLADGERERVLANVAAHRRTTALAAAAATTVEVTLTRADAPLGRPLGPADEVVVTWTIEQPGDGAGDDLAAGRRRAVRRLLAEAAAQGAAPTDDDLARALGVSRRTILRDMDVLAASGVVLTTRRRRRSAG